MGQTAVVCECQFEEWAERDLDSAEGGASDDRCVRIELVVLEEVAHLHVDELDRLLVGRVRLVQEDHQLLQAHLGGEEHRIVIVLNFALLVYSLSHKY